jgi:hypothetical protein
VATPGIAKPEEPKKPETSEKAGKKDLDGRVESGPNPPGDKPSDESGGVL